MVAVRVYPEAVETHLYWNLLKDLSDNVKIQLFVKLKDSLLAKNSKAVDVDAQTAYYAILNKLKTYQGYAKGWEQTERQLISES